MLHRILADKAAQRYPGLASYAARAVELIDNGARILPAVEPHILLRLSTPQQTYIIDTTADGEITSNGSAWSSPEPANHKIDEYVLAALILYEIQRRQASPPAPQRPLHSQHASAEPVTTGDQR